jgi:hypothetical protein
MNTTQIICRAKRPGLLVLCDEDRRDLRGTLARRIPAPGVGLAIMDTHVHGQYAAPPAVCVPQAELALHEFIYRRNRRHPEARGWEREPVTHYTANDAESLSVALKYIHENPVKARMCSVSWHHPWGSAREYAGLSGAGDIDVRLARTLLGQWVGRIGVPAIELADTERSPAPSASLDILLAAAAAFYGLPPDALLGGRPDMAIALARSLFVRLARLERYSDREAASHLGLSRGRAWQARNLELPPEHVAGARTLLVVPRLRLTLPRRSPADFATA